MSRWRASSALVRAVLVSVAGLAGALVTGSPVLVVLAAPFVVLAVMGVVSRPAEDPVLRAHLDHRRLHEGQGTTSRLLVEPSRGVEHVTRAAAVASFVATNPTSGVVGALLDEGAPDLAFGPRRWGRRALGVERVTLTSDWAGWRWGPVDLPADELVVLPQSTPYDSRAEVPQPDGLVGAHRSRRVGSGTELEGIRPFAAGDRLRRISWPVSLRTNELHVVATRAEQDAGVWLVVDALRDIGRSGGIDGRASSLDLTVRAAAALAEHHLRQGDRVGLHVVGDVQHRVQLGSGTRHLHRITGMLARVRTGHSTPDDTVAVSATSGSVVHVLSPMLFSPVVTATVSMLRRGLSVVVIDTLGDEPRDDTGADQSMETLAWRMWQIERDDRLDRLATLGCPVVRWRGPRTLDEVLHRLARRAQIPRVSPR